MPRLSVSLFNDLSPGNHAVSTYLVASGLETLLLVVERIFADRRG